MSGRRSPYDLVSSTAPTQTATKAELLEHVRGLERAALGGPPVAFAVACLQDGRFLTAATTEVYAELARRGAQVLVLGRGVHAAIAPGVTGVDLDDDDPLGDEWTVLLAGRSFSCFVAQDLLDDSGDDAHRRFRWAQTDDPQVVAAAYDVLAGDVRRRSSVEVAPYPQDDAERAQRRAER